MRLITKFFWRFLALACALLAAWGAWRYPVAGAWLGGGMLAYALILWRYPAAWLLVLPALMPVLDLTPWSGWFFVEEIDLFVLTTLALGYWRVPESRPDLGLSPIGAVLLLMLGLSYGISAYLGLIPLSPLDANAFASYMSHFNALRILKGFVWAILLLPLLTRARAQNSKALSHWLVAGMMLGLAGATLASWWERWTFVGLMDFATDYRITALFSGMHTGGAALDGFLALSVPFALAWMVAQENWRRAGLGLVLFVTASYAVFATFSRGLYMAYGLIILLGLMALFKPTPAAPRSARSVLLASALMAVAGLLLWRVFGTAGYRGLAVFVVLYAAIGLLVPLLRAGRYWLGSLLLLPLALAITWMLTALSGKGVYLACGISAGVLLLAGDLISARSPKVSRFGRIAAATALLWLGVNAVWVSLHWGGNAALRDAVFAATAGGLVLLGALRAPKVWSLNRRNIWLLCIGLFALAMAVPAMHSYRMQGRFATAHEDLSERVAHWRNGLAIMDADAVWLGMGLGRFPETYYWRNPVGEYTGTYRIEQTEDHRNVLELGGARTAAGHGEPIRVGQRVGLSQRNLYKLHLEARTSMPKARLNISLCEKWLLYRGVCSAKEVDLQASAGRWQSIDANLINGGFSVAPWFARPTLQFMLLNDTGGSVIEVANVSLKNFAGRELLGNGDFTHGMDHWFFTSDHHHLPWHAKNLWLNIYFDQGLLGLTAFTLLLIYALYRLLRARPDNGTLNFALLASLAGFLVVGLFDSLLDVPRLAWLFYLLLLTAMLKEKNKRADAGKRRRQKIKAPI